MVEDIIKEIDLSIDWIGSKFGLIEHVENQEGNKQPMKYNSNEYTHVNIFQDTSSYWRLNGDVTQEKVMNHIIRRTYPLRLVIASKRDCINEDELFNKVLITLKDIEKTVKPVFSLNKLVLNWTGYVVSREDLAREEYERDIRFRYEFLVLGINLDLIFEASINCLNEFC
jgi:hypothetical protein